MEVNHGWIKLYWTKSFIEVNQDPLFECPSTCQLWTETVQPWTPNCLFPAHRSHIVPSSLAWWRLWNFIGRHTEFHSFLHPNEHTKRFFWYQVKRFDWRPLKIGIFEFSKSIFNVKTRINLSENDFLFSICE